MVGSVYRQKNTCAGLKKSASTEPLDLGIEN